MQRKYLKILLIEDNPADVGLLQRALDRSELEFTLRTVETEEGFVRELHEYLPDIILSDHTLPAFNSMQAFAILKDSLLNIPFILVTGSVSEEFAVACMKAGVSDYILKSSLKRLPTAIENILYNNEIKKEKEVIEALHVELKTAYNKIAEKNKEVTDSINYAKRIQNAMLPDRGKLANCFAESFVYYKPRDIVSGDFYWFEQKHNKMIMAVADCTGHGVPGALMSVIGIELLNKIINERHMTSPSDILRNLNIGITRFFNQQDNESRDGMDIALCAVDFVNKTIEYAGANRPLWLIRDSVFEEIEATKYSIGGPMEFKEYKTTKISFKENDAFYLFTDGVTDQFGGVKGKKLMKKKFKQLLMSIHHHSLDEQHRILTDFIQNWKGINEQVDDMLAIGIRF